ncbi:hypothetical protein [Pyrococcus yayanosii]|uniref:Uncharacterized protein n=1 Tax=Pyrococcus yayanosii (strain CH1 / JCM 16557) TaxID=529709 RepID=F8AHI5_PYRYC|nr:hypothetical protein [Pyrococcus yayanosii]AEH25356.1 hypothetical protein PYCH_16960 [Pyrococcus yayanosii CH1]
MDKKKAVEEIKSHSNYSRTIYEMHEDAINETLDSYEALKESYLDDHPRARLIRIVFSDDNGLPLAMEFNRKDDSFKGFTIAIGKPYVRRDDI